VSLSARFCAENPPIVSGIGEPIPTGVGGRLPPVQSALCRHRQGGKCSGCASTHYLYAAQEPGGLYKIGSTWNPKERIKQLRHTGAKGLRLIVADAVATDPTYWGPVGREQALHRYLAACRVHAKHLPCPTEWFAIGSHTEAADVVRLFARTNDPHMTKAIPPYVSLGIPGWSAAMTRFSLARPRRERATAVIDATSRIEADEPVAQRSAGTWGVVPANCHPG
jgi:Meiotically Up-regulated Gene 113 (MUG113) protein